MATHARTTPVRLNPDGTFKEAEIMRRAEPAAPPAIASVQTPFGALTWGT